MTVPEATSTASTPVHDAVVLAGGQGLRLGGTTKAEVPVAGRPLLDHVLDATSGARAVVIVGPPQLARPGVPTVLEHPPSGGPVAGIDAGMAFLAATGEGPAEAVLVLACDVPRAAGAVPGLFRALAAEPSADGAHLVDEGHAQLVAVYRWSSLAAALARLVESGGVHGRSVRRLLDGLTMVPVEDPDGHGRDADTWEDVARLDSLIARSDP